MPDRHKRAPIALRFPEGDLLWLRAYAERTGQPLRRVVLAAVAELRAAHDPVRTVTERGFVNYDQFTDRYGSEITVRQSSLADEAAVWIFHENPRNSEAMPHLTRPMAIRLRDALNQFLEETDAGPSHAVRADVRSPE